MFEIKTAQFSGPLDLLLRLIEEQELDITKIALAEVADKYMDYVRAAPELPADELADFLLIGAKLVLIKSSVLLPSLHLEEEEGASLEAQLKLYKAFVEASKTVEQMINARQWAFYREEPLRAELKGFHAPKGVTREHLHEAMRHLIARLAPLKFLPEVKLKPSVSIEHKIAEIRDALTKKLTARFTEVLRRAKDKTEVIVSFLALLELVKQRFAVAEQPSTFADIHIKRN